MAQTDIIEIRQFIDERKIGGFQRRVAFLCALAVLMDGFDAQVVGYLVPAIAKSWQIEPHALTGALASGLIGLMFGALTFSVIADRVGRKAVIVLCAILFGAGMLATGTAQSVGELMAWRFITGLGLGGAMPNAIALTAEYAPRRSGATMVMMMFFGFSLGGAIAGIVASQLVPRYGWPSVFYCGGALPLLFAPVLAAILPESVRVLTLRGTEDRRVAALLSRIDPGQLLPASAHFVIREEKAPGLPVLHLFRAGRARSTLLLWCMFFTNLFCLFFLTSWLPTVMTNAGIALDIAVIATSLVQFGGCTGTLVVGPLIDRVGPFTVLSLTYVAAAIFMALIGLSGASVAPIMVAIFAAGFCIIGGQNAMNAVAAMVYPTSSRSTGVGWALGIGRIGAILGPIAGGQMLALHWPALPMFLTAAVPALVTAGASLLLGRSERHRLRSEDGAQALAPVLGH
jgi:AAHS family 4-hydroxybenzoate transporter-like MFS transporter